MCVCVSVCGMSSRSMISLLTFVAVLRCLLRSRMRRWISCSSVWSRTGNCLRLAGCLAIRHIPPVCWLLVHILYICVTAEKIDVVSSSCGGQTKPFWMAWWCQLVDWRRGFVDAYLTNERQDLTRNLFSIWVWIQDGYLKKGFLTIPNEDALRGNFWDIPGNKFGINLSACEYLAWLVGGLYKYMSHGEL